jgi:hypothetical protein
VSDSGHRRRRLDEFAQRVRWLPMRAELDSAAAEVFDAFAARGVESLLLKGPALARMLYGPGEHRGYSDVDLLVAPGDLPRARQALLGIGYSKSDFGLDDVAGILHAETWSHTDGARVGARVDLHWRLPGCEAPAGDAWRALSARRTWIDFKGRNTAVLAREGLALHLATHAAQHGTGDLKAMADLARGIERWDIELWRSAARVAEDVEGTQAFAAGLRLLPGGAELALELGLPDTDDLTWAIRHLDTRPRGTFHLRALAQAQGASERLDVLRRSLLPSRKWVVSHHPWAAASRPRLLAAYVAHLLRAPVWAARAWRYRRHERRAGDYGAGD